MDFYGGYGRRFHARGASLIEALIALLILSIGMLGVAALLVETLRADRAALTRTRAVAFAADMAERIQANSSAASAYEKGADDAGALSAACNGGGGCSPVEMAANDIALWTGMLDDRHDDPNAGRLGLPNGRGMIFVSAGQPRLVVVTVRWQEARQTEPSEYSLRVRI